MPKITGERPRPPAPTSRLADRQPYDFEAWSRDLAYWLLKFGSPGVGELKDLQTRYLCGQSARNAAAALAKLAKAKED